MTRDEFISECRRRSENGESLEGVLVFLRASGCSKIDSMAVIIKVYDMALPQAKEIVHLSRAWSDIRLSDDRFHEAIEDAIIKSESK